MEWLLFLNIVVPLVAGLACLVVSNHKIRAAIVIATAIDLIITSVMIALKGSFEADITAIAGIPIGEVIVIAEFLLLCIILYISYRLRNAIIAVLTLIQIVAAVVLDFYIAPGAEAAPSFYADELSIVMVLLVSIVGSLICVFAIPYMQEHEQHLHLEKTRQPRFFFFMVFFLGAMNALVLVNNIAWLYLFWEITTICSFALIGHDGTEIAIKNATRAIILNMLGGVAFILGIIAIFWLEGTYSIQEIIANGNSVPYVLLPLALFCFAGFTKAAQVPFQSWLLGAMVAPTPVSALLHSSTMVKAGVFLVLRFAPAYDETGLSVFIAVFGVFTFLIASALAISQSNGKRILAYSTIANLGLIITCAGINSPLAIAAAVLIIIFHGVSKGLLFLCVGTIEHEIGSRDLEDMHGLINKMPVTTIIAFIGMVTMLLPPFGMFIGKWGALEAAPAMPYIAVIMIIGSAITMVFWLRWAGLMLSTGYDATKKFSAEAQAFLIKMPLILLASFAVILSILTTYIFKTTMAGFVNVYYDPDFLGNTGIANLITQESSFPLWTVFATLVIGVILGLIAVKNSGGAIASAVYLCGESAECGSLEFRSIEDKAFSTKTSLYYLESSLGEEKLTLTSNVISGMIILAMFGVIFI